MNIVTIDLEEWHTYKVFKKGKPDYYEPILERILEDTLELLEEKSIKATFFCLGILARKHKNIINKIANAGHEIGCHSDKHFFVNSMTINEFKEDTHKAISSLEDVVGKKIISYRAPAFSIDKNTPWAIELLSQNGIEIDCSVFPASRSYGGIKDLVINSPFTIKYQDYKLKEFPINYSKFFNKKIVYSGGGYFRLMPYNLLVNLTKKSDYNMFYFHLRDFDKNQVKVINSRFLLNYYGIKDAFNKFKGITNEFNFISLTDAVKKVDWKFSKTISLQ